MWCCRDTEKKLFKTIVMLTLETTLEQTKPKREAAF